MQRCCSIKMTGERCSIMSTEIRCRLHEKIFQHTGPNATRLTELKLIDAKNNKDILERYQNHRNIETYREEIRVQHIHHLTKRNELLNTIRIETETLGYNADAPYIQRNNERKEALRRERLQRRITVIVEEQDVIIQELARIANDRQNVHTTAVVSSIKKTIERIEQISVPIEYRTETMKTLSEIIDECRPSLKAVWQMTSKFCGNENIYDMGHGIYARVLSSVWQFIKNSEHKDDLKKILCSELEDSIGTCSQGNLSRICNILSGYLEGLELRSTAEIIGEKFHEIRENPDRILVGRAILHNMAIPEDQWAPWLEALEE